MSEDRYSHSNHQSRRQMPVPDRDQEIALTGRPQLAARESKAADDVLAAHV